MDQTTFAAVAGAALFSAVFAAIYFARSWMGLAITAAALCALMILGDTSPPNIAAGLAIIGSGGAFIVLARKRAGPAGAVRIRPARPGD